MHHTVLQVAVRAQELVVVSVFGRAEITAEFALAFSLFTSYHHRLFVNEYLQCLTTVWGTVVDVHDAVGHLQVQ